MTQKEFDYYITKRIDNYMERFFNISPVVKMIYEKRNELNKKIKKYMKHLTSYEINILQTLNNNALLLDVNEELDELLRTKIVAYDIERKCILLKII